MEIGNKLKEAREARGLSLEAVEEETKIRRKYLKAMEDGQFQILPGSIYTKAFLKNYSRFLNLNDEEIIESYKRRFSVDTRPVNKEKTTSEKVRLAAPVKPRYWLYMAVAVIVVGLVFSLYYGTAGLGLLGKSSLNNAEINNGEEAQTPLQTSEQTQPPTGQSENAGHPPAQANGVNLVLNVKEKRCWMLVIADGTTVFQGEVVAGQSRNFAAKEKINITLGNAGAVEVLFNGDNLGFLGGDGAVVNREFTPQ